MKKTKLTNLIAITIIASISITCFTGCGSSSKKSGEDKASVVDVSKVDTKLKNAKLDGEEAPSEGTMITTMVGFTPAPAGHGNPAVNGGPEWSMEPIMYDYLCGYSSQPEKTFKPSLLDTYEFKDRVLTLKLKKDLKWSDGSTLNADDLLCNIFIDMTVNKVAYYADSITKLDDLTVQIKYNSDASLLLDYMLKSPIRYAKKVYGKWADTYQEVFTKNRQLKEDGNYNFTKEGDDKHAATTTELDNYLPDIKEALCSGPYKPTTVTSSEMIFERNPYYRTKMKIEKIKGLRPTSTESTAVAVMNKEYDAEGLGLSPDMAQKVAENNKDTIRQMLVPEYSEFGFCFNVNKAPTDDVKVRQAIAYIIDKEQIAPASEPGMKLGDQYATGLPPSIRDKYFDKDFLGSLNDYSVNRDKAKELLKDAGWKESGGKWVDSNGESPEIKIAGVGEYPAYVVMGEAATNMLKDFGLNATFTPKEAAAYNDYATSGDASMVIDGFGSTQSTQHPFEAYDSLSWYGKRMNIKNPDKGIQVYKDPITGVDFNYTEKLLELFKTSKDSEVTEKAKEFAKFFNDAMYYIPITEKFYIFRIHNDKLSMAPGQTGEQMKDFYWSGNSNALLGKMLRDNQIYYIK